MENEYSETEIRRVKLLQERVKDPGEYEQKLKQEVQSGNKYAAAELGKIEARRKGREMHEEYEAEKKRIVEEEMRQMREAKREKERRVSELVAESRRTRLLKERVKSEKELVQKLKQEAELRKSETARAELVKHGVVLEKPKPKPKPTVSEKIKEEVQDLLPAPERIFMSKEEFKAKSAVEFREKGAFQLAEPVYAGLRGIYTGIREEPVKAGLIAGAAFLAPPIVGPIAAGVAGLGPVAAAGVGIASIGLPIFYGASVIERVKKKEGAWAMGEEFGWITGTEILPAAAGGYAASKIWPKVKGYLETRKRKEIPTKKIVPKKVITGEERFVVGGKKPFGKPRAIEHKKTFLEESFKLPGQKKPVMYHAAPSKWKDPFVVAKGTSELPGVYGAPKVSPHFLKIEKKTILYGGTLAEPFKTPAVMAIEPTKFETIGFKKIPGMPGMPLGYKYVGVTKTGIAYVPGMKPEVEALITPTTKLMKTGADYFFRWKGVRVPIDQFKAIGTGIVSTGAIGTISTISPSYRAMYSAPVVTPSAVAVATVASEIYKLPKKKPAPIIKAKPSKPVKPKVSPISIGKVKPFTISMPVKPKVSAPSVTKGIGISISVPKPSKVSVFKGIGVSISIPKPKKPVVSYVKPKKMAPITPIPRKPRVPSIYIPVSPPSVSTPSITYKAPPSITYKLPPSKPPSVPRPSKPFPSIAPPSPKRPPVKKPYVPSIISMPKQYRPITYGITKRMALPKRRRPRPSAPLGFTVQVRKAGKWIPASPYAFKKTTALAFGARLTERTPRASFKITPSKRRPVPTGISWKFPSYRFRAPVRKGRELLGTGIYIEKTKYRIDMPREFAGITLKGIAAPKKRRKKKKRKGIWI